MDSIEQLFVLPVFPVVWHYLLWPACLWPLERTLYLSAGLAVQTSPEQ